MKIYIILPIIKKLKLNIKVKIDMFRFTHS